MIVAAMVVLAASLIGVLGVVLWLLSEARYRRACQRRLHRDAD